MNVVIQTETDSYIFESVKYVELLDIEEIHMKQDGSIPAIVICEKKEADNE